MEGRPAGPSPRRRSRWSHGADGFAAVSGGSASTGGSLDRHASVGGCVMKTARISAVTAENDRWIRRATAVSIGRAKDVVGAQGPIRPNTPIGRLSDSDWGWIVSTAISGWVMTRAEQAASEGLDLERAPRVTGLDPDPWDLGSVIAILPQLAKACAGFDWSKPARQWSKDELAEFLLNALHLVRRALAARDNIESQVAGTGGIRTDVLARRMNGSVGNPLMTIDELRDENIAPF